MRDGAIVFDGTPEELTTQTARDIYGADDSFSEATTSTQIEARDPRLEKLARIAAQ
jgi:phosphonate transport system ATP-binding protein